MYKKTLDLRLDTMHHFYANETNSSLTGKAR